MRLRAKEQEKFGCAVEAPNYKHLPSPKRLRGGRPNNK